MAVQLAAMKAQVSLTVAYDLKITVLRSMARSCIYLVPLDPTAAHEQSGSHPVLVVSPAEFNKATRLPKILPITNGSEFACCLRFAVQVTGIIPTGVVRCDQPHVIDSAARLSARSIPEGAARA